MKYNKTVIIVICLASGLLSCLSNSKLDSDFYKAALVGKITDRDNLPCTNVTVTIDKTKKTISDINGNFYFQNVQRGKHLFTFSKPGYRTEEREYEFLNISQVIYQKMISLEQIIAEIENSIDQKKYDIAQQYIEEGKKIDENNVVLNFLEGVFYYKAGRYDLALEKLESMVASGIEDPYIYLTLTDIYELKNGDYAKAYENLLKYLDLVDDNAAKLRMTVLEGFLRGSEETQEEPAPEENAEDGE